MPTDCEPCPKDECDLMSSRSPAQQHRAPGETSAHGPQQRLAGADSPARFVERQRVEAVVLP